MFDNGLDTAHDVALMAATDTAYPPATGTVLGMILAL